MPSNELIRKSQQLTVKNRIINLKRSQYKDPPLFPLIVKALGIVGVYMIVLSVFVMFWMGGKS